MDSSIGNTSLESLLQAATHAVGGVPIAREGQPNPCGPCMLRMVCRANRIACHARLQWLAHLAVERPDRVPRRPRQDYWHLAEAIEQKIREQSEPGEQQ